MPKPTFARILTSLFSVGSPTDSQISSVVRGFYEDENFQKDSSGEVGLWQLFNLFTEASKGLYIDRYLARNQCFIVYLGPSKRLKTAF